MVASSDLAGRHRPTGQVPVIALALTALVLLATALAPGLWRPDCAAVRTTLTYRSLRQSAPSPESTRTASLPDDAEHAPSFVTGRSCKQEDAAGNGKDCSLRNHLNDTLFLLDLPSPSRVRQLAGPLELPAAAVPGSGATLVSASRDPARWPGYSLALALDSGSTLVERPPTSDRVIELAGRWGPLHFVSVSNNVTKASANLLRSAAYIDPLLPGGHRWAVVDATRSGLRGITTAYNAVRYSGIAGNASGYRSIIAQPSDIVVFLHDDVHLLPNFELSIYEQVDRLHASDTDTWCGIALATAVRVDRPGGNRGRWLDWGMQPFNMPMLESPQEAMLVPDEAMIVTLRGSPGQFSSQLNEFHCYGLDFALSCLAAGRFVHITDHFVASHKTWHADGRLTRHNQDFPPWHAQLDRTAMARAGEFVTKQWKHTLDLRQLGTTGCPINKTTLTYRPGGPSDRQTC